MAQLKKLRHNYTYTTPKGNPDESERSRKNRH